MNITQIHLNHLNREPADWHIKDETEYILIKLEQLPSPLEGDEVILQLPDLRAVLVRCFNDGIWYWRTSNSFFHGNKEYINKTLIKLRNLKRKRVPSKTTVRLKPGER